MKKLLILLITLLTPFEFAYGEVVRNYGHPTVYKTIYFKAGEKDANKILYEYIKNVSTKESLAQWEFTDECVCAYKIDLDDDGVNEIIGYAFPLSFWGALDGTDLFILKKDKTKYINISYIQFSPYKNLYMMSSKENGYHDLKFNFINPQAAGYGYSSYTKGHYEYNNSKMLREQTRN